MKPNNYGFSLAEWTEILNVFTKHHKIEMVTLFGSRAKNTFKPASDVDIAVRGESINYSDLIDLHSDFTESTIPYFFDILNYQNIESEELKEHIKQYGIIIYPENINEE